MQRGWIRELRDDDDPGGGGVSGTSGSDVVDGGNDEPGLVAGECENGHLTVPTHPRCPRCGEPQDGRVDLTDRTAEVVTWTESTATPPGVRQPNPLAIVEFEVDSVPVRAIGGLTESGVEVGDEVRPVYVPELRDPHADVIRVPESIDWDGYRFEPV